MFAEFRKLLVEDSGQGLLEYSLILFFIAIAAVLVLQTLGNSIHDLYSFAVDRWPN